jgi:hypothetical protein
MNNWRAIGYIFTSFGVIFLLIGIILGILASSLFWQVLPQVAPTLFIAAFTPYAIIASFMFVVGAVGLYAGRASPIPNETLQDDQQSSQNPVSLQASPPLPKQAACPSCEQPIIFMEQYQRWYCPEERKYV